jgi:hypothetical protein
VAIHVLQPRWFTSARHIFISISFQVYATHRIKKKRITMNRCSSRFSHRPYSISVTATTNMTRTIIVTICWNKLKFNFQSDLRSIGERSRPRQLTFSGDFISLRQLTTFGEFRNSDVRTFKIRLYRRRDGAKFINKISFPPPGRGRNTRIGDKEVDFVRSWGRKTENRNDNPINSSWCHCRWLMNVVFLLTRTKNIQFLTTWNNIDVG